MPEIDGALRQRDGRSPRPGDAVSPPQLYGALDLGTNNCRLLIARPAREGFRVVDSFSRIVRLGEGVSRSGRLSQAAMDRAYEALAICADRIARRHIPAERVVAVATQACRAADNGQAFSERVLRGTGLHLNIITPAEEARLSVVGCRNLIDSRYDAVLVVDVGGGSTELSWLVRTGREMETVAWLSVPVGVVSLGEAYAEPSEGTGPWYQAMIDHVAHHLGPNPLAPAIQALFDRGRAHMIGTSGAITSLAGIHLKLPKYYRDKVDGLWMGRDDCEQAAKALLAMGAHGRAANPCIGPDRADLVMAGAAILEAVQRVWPCQRVRVADRGLREGLLLEQMQLQGRQRRNRGRRR